MGDLTYYPILGPFNTRRTSIHSVDLNRIYRGRATSTESFHRK